MCSDTSLPRPGNSVNVGMLMVTSYPTPPVSMIAWLGCFAASFPRRCAIMPQFYRVPGGPWNPQIRAVLRVLCGFNLIFSGYSVFPQLAPSHLDVKFELKFIVLPS